MGKLMQLKSGFRFKFVTALLTALLTITPAVMAVSPADAAARKPTNHVIKPLAA